MDRSYVRLPACTSPATPIVVLAPHLFGVDRFLRDAADRFARAGYATVAVDLYAGIDAPDGDVVDDPAAFIPLARSLSSDAIDAAFDRARAAMRERGLNGKVVIAGFCMGGVMATYRAARGSGRYDAAAAWYGLSNDVAPAEVTIPLVGSYGTDDASIPVDRVRAFYDALPLKHDVEIYPDAGHAFCDFTRPSYAATASEDSWRRALAFLHGTVGEP